MARGKTAEVRRSEAHLYLAKAQQLVEAAQSELEADRFDVALLNAIHAGINGIDAVTSALLGLRSTDPDHFRVIDLLEETAGRAPEVKDKAKQLRALLGRKNAVEYESRPAKSQDAREAVERASRILGWAREVVRNARV